MILDASVVPNSPGRFLLYISRYIEMHKLDAVALCVPESG